MSLLPSMLRRPALPALLLVAGGIAGCWSADSATAQRPAPPAALSQAGGPVAGETYQWKPVAIGGGGMISGLSTDRSGRTFVARTDVHGAYVWDVRRDRWRQLVTATAMPADRRVQNGGAGGVYEIVVAPSRAQRLYMAFRGQVYRSDDGGDHWIDPHPGNPFPFRWNANSEYRLHGPFMAVAPDDPDTVLLGTPEAGLWRSTDAGATWARVVTVPPSRDLKPDAGFQAPGVMLWFDAAGARLFALSPGNGMFVSTDRGARFRPLATGAGQPRTLQRGTFDRRGNFFGGDDLTRSLWAYRDGRWTDLTATLGLDARDYAAVVANPRADQLIAVDRGGAGYASTDGGLRWRRIAHSAVAGPGDPPWLTKANGSFFTTADMLFDPVVPGRLWAASGVGVFHATVAANSMSLDWISRTRGIEELVANDVVQPPGGAPAFAGWDFGIHVKSDLNAFSTTFAPGERTLISAQQLDWSPADPGFLVTNASDARIGCCTEDGNAVMAGTSRDGGRSWRKFATLPTPPGTDPADARRMAFGTIAVSASDPGTIVWAPSDDRQPFATRDGGTTWHPVRLPGATGDRPGSFGGHWLQRKTMIADRVLPDTFYHYHSGGGANAALAGLWRSTDGGRQWTLVHRGVLAPASDMAAKLRAVPGHAGHLFFTAGFEHTDDTALRRSTDGGAHWETLTDITRVDDIAFGKAARGAAYPAIFLSGRISGDYGIWRSVDGARSWQRLIDFPVGRLDQVTVVGADPDVFGRVYLGYLGSGWIWGEPAPCTAAPLKVHDERECAAVR